MGKPVAAVVLEGTVVTHTDLSAGVIGDWLPEAPAKLTELQKTHTILIVSPFAKTLGGARLLMSRLYADSVPFDEIWLGDGFPEADVRYDNAAVKL